MFNEHVWFWLLAFCIESASGRRCLCCRGKTASSGNKCKRAPCSSCIRREPCRQSTAAWLAPLGTAYRAWMQEPVSLAKSRPFFLFRFFRSFFLSFFFTLLCKPEFKPKDEKDASALVLQPCFQDLNSEGDAVFGWEGCGKEIRREREREREKRPPYPLA